MDLNNLCSVTFFNDKTYFQCQCNSPFERRTCKYFIQSNESGHSCEYFRINNKLKCECNEAHGELIKNLSEHLEKIRGIPC